MRRDCNNRCFRMIELYSVVVAGSYSTEYLFPQARNYIQSLSYMPKMNFENVFIGANPLGKACFLNVVLFLKLKACPGTPSLFPKFCFDCGSSSELRTIFKVYKVCVG